MRIAIFLLLNVLASQAWANDLLWEKLRTEANLVVLMRHAQPAGGHPLTWDESGNCKGESMLTAAGKAHARKIGEEFAKHRLKPTLSLELINKGELLVGRANAKGEIDILGKITVDP